MCAPSFPPAARGVAWIATLLGLTACTGNPAPRGWLAPAAQAQSGVYGGWIELRYEEGERERELEGELIALADDTLFVLSDSSFQALPRTLVRRARVTGYDPATGLLSAWTVGGIVGTASHGGFLIISLPVWILSGSLAANANSSAAKIEYPDGAWAALRKYARYPQGLPPGLDRKALAPKPVMDRARRD